MTSNPNTSRLESAVPILLIHGVGNPTEGSIAESVQANLASANLKLPLIEFNWNRIAKYQSVTRGIEPDHVAMLGASLLAAAEVSGNANAPSRYLYWVGSLVFRLGVGLAVLSVLIAPAVALLLVFIGIGSIPMDAGVRGIRWTVECSLAMGALGLISLIGSLIIAATARSRSPWRQELRRVLFILLWPLIGLSFFPLAIPWLKPKTALGSAAVAAIVLVVALATFPVLRANARGIIGVRHLGSMMLIVVACWIGLILLRTGLRHVLKIVLDVVQYAGDPEHRQTIQSALDETLRALFVQSKGRELILVAHSLGSVIAFDSLCNSTAWPDNCRVRVATVGSPLRRFFWSFFPDLYLPASPERVIARVNLMGRELRWLNVYRPLDFIGAKLGLPVFCNEVSTRQLRDPFSSHINYWSDRLVLNIVRSWIGGLQTLPESKVTYAEVLDSHGRASPRRVNADRLAVAGIGLLLACVTTSSVLGYLGQRQDAAAGASRLSAEGVRAKATISHYREVKSGAQSSFAEDHFTISALDVNGKPIDRSFVSAQVLAGRVDSDPADADAIIDAMLIARHEKTGFFRGSSARKKDPWILPDVTLIYLPDDERVFAIEEFPPSKTTILVSTLAVVGHGLQVAMSVMMGGFLMTVAWGMLRLILAGAPSDAGVSNPVRPTSSSS